MIGIRQHEQKLFIKMGRLRKLMIGYTDAWMQSTDGNDLEKRQRKRKMVIHLLILCKMHARTIDSIFDGLIDRQDSKQALAMIREMRRMSGRAILSVIRFSEQLKVQLSAHEMKTVFSIPKDEWDEFRRGDQDLLATALTYADQSVMEHVGRAVLDEVRQDRNQFRRMILKGKIEFPDLFPNF